MYIGISLTAHHSSRLPCLCNSSKTVALISYFPYLAFWSMQDFIAMAFMLLCKKPFDFDQGGEVGEGKGGISNHSGSSSFVSCCERTWSCTSDYIEVYFSNYNFISLVVSFKKLYIVLKQIIMFTLNMFYQTLICLLQQSFS